MAGILVRFVETLPPKLGLFFVVKSKGQESGCLVFQDPNWQLSF